MPTWPRRGRWWLGLRLRTAKGARLQAAAAPVSRRPASAAGRCALSLMLAVCAGCSKRTKPQPIESRPAEQATPAPDASSPVDSRKERPAPPPRVAAGPSTTQTAATGPAATGPAATVPVSAYDNKPPYPVTLHVRSLEDKQPGWLRIEALSDTETLATAKGVFPEKNKILVETENVRRIRIHLGQLPLAEKKRTVLRIDGKGIEITRTDRRYITLERSPGGIWEIVKDSPEK